MPQQFTIPASVDTERAVLGSVLCFPDLYDEAVEFLTDDDWHLDAHRRIWRSICYLREHSIAIDMISMAAELDQRKEVEAIGGIAYLSSLIDGVPERPSIKHYIAIVKQKSLLRGLIRIAEDSISQAQESQNAEEAIAHAEAAIMRLSEDLHDRTWATFANSVESAGGLDGYLNRITNPAVVVGTPTGYEKLDDLIGGLTPATLIIIAARPSHGKTNLALNICQNILLRICPEFVIPFFSLEMSKQAIETRMLSSMSGVNLRGYAKAKNIEFQFDSRPDTDKVSDAMAQLIDKKLFIDDGTYLTPIRLRSRCRQLKSREGRLDLVVLDYLQLMSGGSKFENRNQEVSAISRGLKAAAKELNCPIIALSQLSRAPEGRADKRPMLSDLRESGSIEQDADVVVFIHRPELYSPEPDVKGLCELIVAKNRDGATGTANLCFLAERGRFENLAIS